MQRREFISKFFRRAGIGAGVVAAGTAGLVGYYQPRKELYEIDDNGSGEAQKPVSAKKVVVIGGGLAGISASIELARHGFVVTLVESSSSLGGKLTGWTLDALGEKFPVEHGFHGFFDQYYNLNEMFAFAGVSKDVFDASPGYPILFKNRPAEIYGQTPKYFPFNILSVVWQSRSLDLVSFLRDYQGLWPVIGMFRYRYGKTFQDYDSIDFMTYCQRGNILPAFIDTVLHPFAYSTMNRMEVLSSAEAIRYFHFYFMASPEGLSFRITNRDCMSALIDPLRRKLEELGVTIRSGRKALRLTIENERVTGVVLQSGGGSGQIYSGIAVSDVPSSGWAVLSSSEGVPVLVSKEGSGYSAFDARCTHMGCPVAPHPESGGFFCPCHAGKFDAAGNPVSGPPKAPLQKLSVTQKGEQLLLALPLRDSPVDDGDDFLECDYCIAASDVRGTRELVRLSGLNKPDFERQVSSLGEADPYAVYRLWLDRPLLTAAFPFYTVSGYTYTDSVSIYSAFQEPFISWGKKNQGAVIELHAYAIAPEDVRPEEEIKAAMQKELHHLFPETEGATILHELYMQQSNFTRWAPGDHAGRPSTETPLSNLFLAGDWIKVDAPVFLMEAAAFTGRMAANAIFIKEKVKPVPLPIVSMEGLFA
ncbi:MAG: Rieske 2Fe-2S domain-containing protein [Chlorobiaceae bacterium]|nr:Rieske 2Fe-2S domain-containing protein [Chlorobiaceae bacterium]